MKNLLRSLSLVAAMSLAVPGLALAESPKKEAAKEARDAAKKAAPSGPIDLNTASQSELESLNGVGPATAKKIIAGRPFSSVSDLSKAGVSAATIAKIGSMVMVGKAAPVAAPAPVAKVPASVPAPAAPASMPASTPVTSPVKAAAKTAAPMASNSGACAAGQVWANLETKVYHFAGDRWFGNTKKGQCMNQADADKAGYRAAKEGAAKKKQ